MNQLHLEFLASPAWATFLEEELLPWLVRAGELGDDVLEIGPGPGLTTDLLRARVAHVTALELDAALAMSLSERLAGTNVSVVHADATESGLPSDGFSAVASFSMFHHVPSVELQDRVLGEAYRMLAPGGLLVCVDSRDAEAIRRFHEDDVFVPLDPSTLQPKLQALGFSDVRVELTDFEVRFSAKK